LGPHLGPHLGAIVKAQDGDGGERERERERLATYGGNSWEAMEGREEAEGEQPRIVNSLSIDVSNREEEHQNLLLPESTLKKNQYRQEQQQESGHLDTPGGAWWSGSCSHGRWHPFASAGCGVVAAIVVAFVIILSQVLTKDACSSSNSKDVWGLARPLQRLEKPLVILVSSDGFRYGYNWKTATPNIDWLRMSGTEAEPGMIPVFPSKTFPNHYSIATGLYPAYHGIILNSFKDPDTNSTDVFYPGNLNPKWWLGEPIWETVVNQGLQAATYFWPGSQVKKGNWTCDPAYCHQYSKSVPYEERVDTVLGYVDLPKEIRPSLITLYFEAPDEPGHSTGPDAPQVTSAVARIDNMMGRLLAGLKQRGVLDDVTVIMVGDHGMVADCEDKMIFLEDIMMSPGVSIPLDWVISYSPVLAIRPPADVDVVSLHRTISHVLASGNVKNAEFLQVYLKEQLPPRLHYSESPRIPPIIGLVGEGYTLASSRTVKMTCGGNHGYDNMYLSMRTIFIAAGPQFAKGRRIPSFVNVELYQLMTTILGLNPAANNATSSFAQTVLLPHK
jgi:ectonucleotide pyrophosphatase/phosphodiesterase family protein 1/3